MNKCILIGRITKDVELKKTPTDVSVVSNTIAVTRNFKTNGEYESDFINFVAYRTTADLITKYCKKGDRIGLTGRWQNRSYDNQNGVKVYVSELIVEDIEFLQEKKEPKQEEPKQNNPFDIPTDDLPF